MKISYYTKENVSETNDSILISEIPNFSLPRIFPINKDIKLLSCSDTNFDMYKSVFGFGFNTKTVWIEFPKTVRGNSIEYFLIGISFDYLRTDFVDLNMISVCKIKNILEVHLNQHEQLIKILQGEFDNFSTSISSSGLTSRNVSTFSVKVAYYLYLFLVIKIKEYKPIVEEELVMD